MLPQKTTIKLKKLKENPLATSTSLPNLTRNSFSMTALSRRMTGTTHTFEDAEEQKHANMLYADSRVILIKPTVDASNKELHKRN